MEEKDCASKSALSAMFTVKDVIGFLSHVTARLCSRISYYQIKLWHLGRRRLDLAKENYIDLH